MSLRKIAIGWLLLSGMPVVGRADDAGIEFFEKKIRPALVEHCYECHSADARKLGGGLLLDSREGVRNGGDTGPAVVPGRAAESLLLKAISYADDGIKMPPKGKLPAAVIADFEAWVKLGAPDPREAASPSRTANSWEEILRTRRNWWSLQPVRKPAVPQPANLSWSEDSVDRFILVKLEERGLTPAKPADPRTLARRLSLVLTGLPPTPAQVDAFVAERETAGARQALEGFVDALLDSPHFGERWARHWMDVVRFTETHGNEWNYEVHHAWRYRDYLIRAFNDDVPYDRFIREHIAGDLLPQPRWNEKERFNESPIGTAFYRFGEVNHDDCIGLRSIGFDLADNQIDTLTKAFQATTVACARCHDHKLDAVSMRDYYALLGILRSSRMVAHTIDAPDVNAAGIGRLRELKEGIRGRLAEIWRDDAGQIGRYLLAAVAKQAGRDDAEQLAAGLDPARLAKWGAMLGAEKLPVEHPFEPWRMLAKATAAADAGTFEGEWKRVTEHYDGEDRRRDEFNRTQFETFADFRNGNSAGWQISGQGLCDAPAGSGDFSLHHEGNSVVKAIFSAGCFTGGLSEKLNGTLRSPVLPLGKAHISFRVMGAHSSAVRLVSNNCQLNYKNYRALTSDGLQWVTFSPPDDRDALQTYAELMTMFDNPKFPDQLSALGGDKENYRLPWEKAAENPRSHFGITQVVLHDGAEPPKPELSHVRRLFAGDGPVSIESAADRYAAIVVAAVRAWETGEASDDDVCWLDALLRHELLTNDVSHSPRLAEMVEQYRRVEAELSLPRIVPGIADGGPGIEQPLFIRGDCLRPGETVARRYLEVLSTRDVPVDSESEGASAGGFAPKTPLRPQPPVDSFAAPGSGRLELADRIADPANPLTARVMVNRVWHHLFGTGLVRTVDDFGHVGETPSHPELLDYLAAEFVEEGWSMKRLIRRIVLSQTFQTSNVPPSAARESDPGNRLLAHYPARRMEAEAVRDSILAASGRLDRALFGMSVYPYREKEYADRRLFPGPLDGDGRRSLYIKNNLMEPPSFLGAFNTPGGKVTQGRRDVTNVPAQALALLNDPLVIEQAGVWAERLIAQRDRSISERIDGMFRTALGRRPTDEERRRFEQAAVEFARLRAAGAGVDRGESAETKNAGGSAPKTPLRPQPPAELLTNRGVWQDVAHAMFNLKEFTYIP